jgi:hypothetical protein
MTHRFRRNAHGENQRKPAGNHNFLTALSIDNLLLCSINDPPRAPTGTASPTATDGGSQKNPKTMAPRLDSPSENVIE